MNKKLKDFIGKKVMMQNATGTTTNGKMYEVLPDFKYPGERGISLDDIYPYSAEVTIINDNGHKISVLASRLNFNSWK